MDRGIVIQVWSEVSKIDLEHLVQMGTMTIHIFLAPVRRQDLMAFFLFFLGNVRLTSRFTVCLTGLLAFIASLSIGSEEMTRC